MGIRHEPPKRRATRRPATSPEFLLVRRIGYAAAAGLAVLFILWFALTYPARSELRRVQAVLEAHEKFQNVNLDTPLFARALPPTVPFTGIWVPGGFSYDVQIEVKGEYDTAARTARVQGRKQILMPYRKVVIDETITVPPP
jgi:hypothetical protein